LRASEPILGLDVDSTIWNPVPWIYDAVHDITGGELDLEACTTWTHVLDAYGEEAAIKIYTCVLSPERVRERDPYPSSAEVLRDLQEQGVRLHFITHNWDPEAMTPYLEPWLKKHFGPDVGLSVTVEDKLGILDSLGAFGMVDDRPDTIASVANAGLWAATMIQPWNRKLVAERADIYGFERWHEVPDLLPPLPKGANDV
jgi:phosphoglycolate phosphatase-like HAD superfamily hydrolase